MSLKLTYTSVNAGSSGSSESDASKSNVMALNQIDTDDYDGNILLYSLDYIRPINPHYGPKLIFRTWKSLVSDKVSHGVL